MIPFEDYLLSESIQQLIDIADQLHLMPEEGIQKIINDPIYGASSREEMSANMMREWKLKDQFRAQFGYAIPCKEAIEAIRAHNNGDVIIDLMAGTGYWTGILQSAGFSVKAYDIAPGSGQHTDHEGQEVSYGMQGVRPGVRVKTKDAVDAVDIATRWSQQNDKKANFFMSWPPYDEPIGAEVAKRMLPGSILFYIGEGGGGCTGCDTFHAILDEQFDRLDNVHIPQFDGMHDSLMIYRKK